MFFQFISEVTHNIIFYPSPDLNPGLGIFRQSHKHIT